MAVAVHVNGNATVIVIPADLRSLISRCKREPRWHHVPAMAPPQVSTGETYQTGPITSTVSFPFRCTATATATAIDHVDGHVDGHGYFIRSWMSFVGLSAVIWTATVLLSF